MVSTTIISYIDNRDRESRLIKGKERKSKIKKFCLLIFVSGVGVFEIIEGNNNHQEITLPH